jgi:hypothetical protein
MDFKVDHGGKNDVRKDMKTAMHQASIKCQKSTPAATNFFTKSKSDQDDGKFVFFTIGISSNFLIDRLTLLF